jgi:hypothetical protein
LRVAPAPVTIGAATGASSSGNRTDRDWTVADTPVAGRTRTRTRTGSPTVTVDEASSSTDATRQLASSFAQLPGPVDETVLEGEASCAAAGRGEPTARATSTAAATDHVTARTAGISSLLPHRPIPAADQSDDLLGPIHGRS